MDKPILRCRICEEELNRGTPRTLSCGHSICKECEEFITPTTSDVRCPECYELFVARKSSDVRLTFPWLSFPNSLTSSEFEDAAQFVSSKINAIKLENVQKKNSVYIDDYGRGPSWRANSSEYTCQIISPKTHETSYGVRHHVTYTILPSFTNNCVLRTYGNFESANNHLAAKYPFIVLPPLPERQLIGSCIQEYIEVQRSLLQNWINRICCHPVLSQNPMFQRFITVSNDKSWEANNEEINNDEPVIKCLLNIPKLEESSCTTDVQQLIREQDIFITTLNKELVSLQNICRNTADSYKAFYMQEYDKLSFAFQMFSQALKTDGSGLSTILHHVSKAYSDIGKLCVMADGKEWRSLENTFFEYQSLLEGLGNICSFASRTLSQSKQSNPNKSNNIQKVSASCTSNETMDVTDNFPTSTLEANIVALALKAEISYFHQQITRDFGTAIKAFVVEQMHLYQRITEKLRECLERVVSGDEESSTTALGTREIF